MKKIKISEIIERLDYLGDDTSIFINCDTLKIYEIEDHYFRRIEEYVDVKDLPEWEQETLKLAIEIDDDSDKYISFPSKYDINEYRIMRDFCYTLSDNLADLFLEAISGKGAFRQFKNLINYYHLYEKWDDFKIQRLYIIAKEFCEDNNISYEDDYNIKEDLPIYQKEYKIEISDVDFNKQLKLSTIFSHFQDVASEAVEKLGIGVNLLTEKYNVTWVLIKMHVEVLRYPLWNETISIETWPRATEALVFERDFLVYDSKGEVIIKAASTWVLLDIKTRKIKRTNTIELPYSNVDKSVLELKTKKIKHYNKLTNAYSRMIGYSDIDINGHINNSKYIDFITDCFTFQEHQMYDVKTIEVNFINETLPGETLVLSKDLSKVRDNIIYVQGENENKIIFKAEVKVIKR